MNKIIHIGIVLGVLAFLPIVKAYAYTPSKPYIEVQSPAYKAGAAQANSDWDSHIKLHVCLGGVGYCPISCPIGHSQDYCMAYTFGYRDAQLNNENG